MKKLALIWCQSRNGVIGKNGKIPWHFPEDLKRFKDLTKGHAIIMGRKTFESLDKALPYRRNIILSSRKFQAPDVEVYTSLQEAIKEAHSTDNMPFIIGGSEIYRQTIVVATRLYVSEIDLHLDGDAKAPDINPNEWVLEKEEESKSPFLTFKEYKKV